MSRIKRLTAIALIGMMVIITTSAWSFAEDDARDNATKSIEDVQIEEGASDENYEGSEKDYVIGGEEASDDRTEDAVPAEVTGEDDASGDDTESEEPLVEAPAKVSTLSGYKSIKVRWSRVNGAEGYMVYASRSAEKPAKPVFRTDKKLSYIYSIKGGRNCYFWVTAYKIINGKRVESNPVRVNDMAVRTMHYNVTLKESRSFSCTCHHGRKKKHIRLKKGTRLHSTGFNSGKHNIAYKGHNFKLSALRVRNAENEYDSSKPYTREEAEFYISRAPIRKKTTKIIWASMYTQHVYVFKRVDGRYKCIRDFGCASGKAPTPSVTGYTRYIRAKWRTNHGRPYWNVYVYGNAFHGIKGREKIDGKPHSHGCIRVNNVDNKWIWNNVPLKSSVVVF